MEMKWEEEMERLNRFKSEDKKNEYRNSTNEIIPLSWKRIKFYHSMTYW